MILWFNASKICPFSIVQSCSLSHDTRAVLYITTHFVQVDTPKDDVLQTPYSTKCHSGKSTLMANFKLNLKQSEGIELLCYSLKLLNYTTYLFTEQNSLGPFVVHAWTLWISKHVSNNKVLVEMLALHSQTNSEWFILTADLCFSKPPAPLPREACCTSESRKSVKKVISDYLYTWKRTDCCRGCLDQKHKLRSCHGLDVWKLLWYSRKLTWGFYPETSQPTATEDPLTRAY